VQNLTTKINIQSQVRLVLRTEIPKEPTYNGGTKRIGAFAEPFVSLDKAKNQVGIEQEAILGKFVKVFYTNTAGQIIEYFGKETEVFLVIQTRNMIGEEVIIDLEEEAQFEYKGAQIEEDKILKMKILNEVERIPLRILPQKEFYQFHHRIGRYEQKILQAYFTDIDGEKIETAAWDNTIYLNIETQNMIGKEVSIDLGEQSTCFKHPKIQGKLLKTVIQADLQQIQLKVE